jgi:esterase/lipase
VDQQSFKYLIRNLSIAVLSWIGSYAPTAHAEEDGSQSELDGLISQLAEAESMYTDIVEGTEKSIAWYDGINKTALSLVYLHGFSASARELSPVTEKLAERLGANVYFARLTGHGRSADAMAEATLEDWLEDTREAWRIGQQIGERVIVISASTGGTLAAWLAAQSDAQTMLANIMISPNFGIASRSGEIIRWDWGLKLAKWINGPYRAFTPQNKLHELYWTERYPIEALRPMIQVVDEVVGQDHTQTTVPHLMIYSPQDKVIRVDRIEELAAKMSNADVELLPFMQSSDPYQHVLAGDACSPETTDQMINLIESYIKRTLKSKPL